MTVLLESLAAESALYYRFSGRVTAEDLDRVRSAEERYFGPLESDNCLNVIIDLSDIDSIAPNLFPQLQRLRMVADNRVCMVVVAGANSYLRALAISLGVITPHVRPYVFRDTADEARRFLTVDTKA